MRWFRQWLFERKLVRIKMTLPEALQVLNAIENTVAIVDLSEVERQLLDAVYGEAPQ